jgi:hypothetical protein
MQLKFRSIISTNKQLGGQLLKVVGIKQSGHVANTRGILFNVIKFRAHSHTKARFYCRTNICFVRAKSEDDPSKQAKATGKPTDWVAANRPQADHMYALAQSFRRN